MGREGLSRHGRYHNLGSEGGLAKGGEEGIGVGFVVDGKGGGGGRGRRCEKFEEVAVLARLPRRTDQRSDRGGDSRPRIGRIVLGGFQLARLAVRQHRNLCFIKTRLQQLLLATRSDHVVQIGTRLLQFVQRRQMCVIVQSHGEEAVRRGGVAEEGDSGGFGEDSFVGAIAPGDAEVELRCQRIDHDGEWFVVVGGSGDLP